MFIFRSVLFYLATLVVVLLQKPNWLVSHMTCDICKGYNDSLEGGDGDGRRRFNWGCRRHKFTS